MAIPYISHLKYDESGVHGWELYLLRSYRTIEYLNQATITLKVSYSEHTNLSCKILITHFLKSHCHIYLNKSATLWSVKR